MWILFYFIWLSLRYLRHKHLAVFWIYIKAQLNVLYEKNHKIHNYYNEDALLLFGIYINNFVQFV